MTREQKIDLTQEIYDRYCRDVDPVLRRLESLTEYAVRVGTTGSSHDVLDVFANRLPNNLQSVWEALIDAKARLAGIDLHAVAQERPAGPEKT